MRARPALLATLLAGVALVLAAPAAGAHATLQESDPPADAVLASSPDRITLTFDEPVSPGRPAVRLLDDDGDMVPVGTVRAVDGSVVAPVPRRLDEGTYVVAWRVVSADSHPVSGAFVFSVGAPSAGSATSTAALAAAGGSEDGAAQVLDDVANGLATLGVLLAVGGAVFLVLVAPSAGGPARRVVGIGAPVGAVGFLAKILTEASVLGAAGGLPAWSDIADQAWGSVGLQALLGVVGLGVVGLGTVGLGTVGLGTVGLGVGGLEAGAGEDAPSEPARGGRRGAVLVGALLAVAAFSVVGHTRTSSPVAVTIAADVAHVAAGAVWTGGLVVLLLHLRSAASRDPGDAAHVVGRFSMLASAAIVAVAATGSTLAWRVAGSWDVLLDTTYGVLLLVKVGLFAVVAALGAVNRFVVVGRVRRAGDGAVAMLRRTLLAECVVVLGVVAVTAVLVGESPNPPGSAPTPAEARAACLARAEALRSTSGSDEIVITCPGDPGDPGFPVSPGVAHDAPHDPTLVAPPEASAAFGDGTATVTLTPAERGVNEVRVHLVDASGAPLIPAQPPVVALRQRERDLGPIEVTLDRVGTSAYAGTVDIPIAGTWEVNVTAVVSDFEQPQAVVELPVEE